MVEVKAQRDVRTTVVTDDGEPVVPQQPHQVDPVLRHNTLRCLVVVQEVGGLGRLTGSVDFGRQRSGPVASRWGRRPDTDASDDAAFTGRAEDALVRRTVLIVDDHADFRSSARLMLEADGFRVVGEAADAAGAIVQARQLRPNVVLLDVQLPDADGFAVAERIATWLEPPTVILISTRDAASYGQRVAGSPARGFIAKADLTGDALTELLG
jgi:CheY-like chemotaxis protein